jgi:CRP-like cAMP-binding protein
MRVALVTFGTSMKVDDRMLDGLRSARVFACLDDRVLAPLARQARRVVHGEGDLVVAEGEPGVGFFVVVDGDAAVSVRGQLVRALGPGDSFGELALATGRPRSATVVAATDLELVAIPAWDFRVFVAAHPCVARSLELQSFSYT